MKFHPFETKDESWFEFECPHCWIDIDFEADEAPKPGESFQCKNCNAVGTVQYMPKFVLEDDSTE